MAGWENRDDKGPVARAADKEISYSVSYSVSLTLNFFYAIRWLYKSRTYMSGNLLKKRGK